MSLNGHNPISISDFQGLWQRGDPDNTPLDHFPDCQNVKFVGSNLVSRDGLGVSQTVAVPLNNVKRIYNYPTQTANTTLVLTYDGTTGKIYHIVDAATIYGPILTITGMEDFAFVPYAGRAYLSPIKNFVTGALNIQKGMQSEFLYVYLGAGVAARKAAGAAPTGNITIANGAAGHTDPGLKVFGVVFESDTGWLSPPSLLETFSTVAGSSVSFGTIPVGGVGSGVVKKHIVVSKTIASFTGNLEGYDLFFIPDGIINDNTTIFVNNVSWYDEELLEDASHLFDNYAEIPAGAALSIYHNRLCLSTTYNDISLILVSAEGEPEAISQIDGLIVVPLDGNPITNHQELRDIFYVTKRSRTVAYVDNGEAPSSWLMTVIDNALGTSIHGIATVLDSGASSVDYLIIATYAGIFLFNGKYINLPITYKIEDLWAYQDRSLYRLIQIINSPIDKTIYIVAPDGTLLLCNYSNGMEWKKTRWTYYAFDVAVNCIAIVNIDEIIIGMDI